jgi:hypothetical protein
LKTLQQYLHIGSTTVDIVYTGKSGGPNFIISSGAIPVAGNREITFSYKSYQNTKP